MSKVIDIPCAVPGLKLGSCGPVLISCFNDWPRGPMLAALAEAQLEHSKTFPRIVSLTIIPSAPPDPNVAGQMAEGERKAVVHQSATIAQELKAITAANVVVILSRGLLAVMIRGFMAALGLASGAGGNLKTFRTLEEADVWFSTAAMPPGMPPALAPAISAWLEPASANVRAS